MKDNPDIIAGRHFCHTCRRYTEWYGTKLQMCEVCSAEFPCAQLHCTHIDCRQAREYYGASDWTDIFSDLE